MGFLFFSLPLFLPVSLLSPFPSPCALYRRPPQLDTVELPKDVRVQVDAKVNAKVSLWKGDSMLLVLILVSASSFLLLFSSSLSLSSLSLSLALSLSLYSLLFSLQFFVDIFLPRLL